MTSCIWAITLLGGFPKLGVPFLGGGSILRTIIYLGVCWGPFFWETTTYTYGNLHNPLGYERGENPKSNLKVVLHRKCQSQEAETLHFMVLKQKCGSQFRGRHTRLYTGDIRYNYNTDASQWDL